MDRLKNLLVHGIKLFNDSKLSIYAGYSTLFIVTAIFPLMMLIISIVNLLPGYSVKDVTDVLLQILPDLDPIQELIKSVISNLKGQSGGLLASAAALTTLWSASKGIMAIQSGLNQLDPYEKEKGIKSIAKRLLFTLLMILLIPALLVFEVLGDSIAKTICNFIEKVQPNNLSKIENLVDSILHASSVVVLLFAFLVILLIYAKLPSVKRTLKSQLPGALVTIAGWFIFTELFAFFVPKFYKSSALYGSLAALFLAMLWLRIIVLILFAGGVLNKTLEDEAKHSPDRNSRKIIEKRDTPLTIHDQKPSL